MYWPAMYNDIIEMIAKCSTWLVYRRENQREPLTPHEVPLLPWQKLGADILEYGGSAYLLYSGLHLQVKCVSYKESQPVR